MKCYNTKDFFTELDGSIFSKRYFPVQDNEKVWNYYVISDISMKYYRRTNSDPPKGIPDRDLIIGSTGKGYAVFGFDTEEATFLFMMGT